MSIHKTIPFRAAWSLGLAASIFSASAAFALRSRVQDHRITMAEAQVWLNKAKATSDFPVVLNQEVLEQLNRFLGTEQGREYVQASKKRMESYRLLLNTKFEQYQAPLELLGVGFAESGYENLPQARDKSAGVWMFIESTARHFGMRVDEQVDERLDVEKETDAAMRYLMANRVRFGDWQLAILAYNMGENSLQRAIDQVGSHKAWDLIRAGYEGDRAYLAKVMAAILILANPEIAD
jgi:hypothetical protein